MDRISADLFLDGLGHALGHVSGCVPLFECSVDHEKLVCGGPVLKS